LKVLDLFSGIGGFSLGLESAGMETVAFCEIEEFPRKVLAKHWPGIPIYEDVRNVTKERLEADGIRPDVVCGGFPCQDISVAGNQKGIHAERSGLWGELCRIIGEVRPKYAIVENVTALISGDSGRWFGRILGDLAEIGYDCEWHCISASELGAHHHRDRVWIICYPKHTGRDATQVRESHQARDGGNEKRQKPASKSQGPGDADNMAHANSTQRERGRLSFGMGEEHANINNRSASGNAIKNVADPISKRQQGQGEYVKPLFAAAIKKWQAINAESGCISGVWAVEPELGRTFDGFPSWLDGHCGRGLSYEESRGVIEVLRSLWSDYISKALWEEIGGLNRIQQAEVLFSLMREYEEGSDEAWLFLEGEETLEGYLRELRGKAGTASAPHRSKNTEQPGREHSDSVPMVSQFSPCDSQANWQRNSWEDGIPRVAHGISDRTHRLKGLGNAVVPQIPELIGRAIMEVENELL